jgi:ribosomal protein S18 acetylase RimI-like enzyme
VLVEMPELRDYRSAEFEQLWDLDRRCFSPAIAYSREELAHYLHNRTAICVVAWDGVRAVGFILGHVVRGSTGHLVTLDVDPAARRTGLGSSLMRTIEQRFRLAGCSSIMLEVAVNNKAALAFYKRHDYSALKVLRRYYPDGLDGFLMGKQLRQQELRQQK